MIHSLAFTTPGRQLSTDIEMFLMPTLLPDSNLFFWIDLEKLTPEETRFALEELSLEIAELEQEALQHPDKWTPNKILQVKKEAVHLRQISGPQREVLARFARGEFKLIRPHRVPYYRNVHDGRFRIHELARSYTDSLTGILQVYLNMSSNQTARW
jgi:Mg2+ and Co2+ transporter CorA